MLSFSRASPSACLLLACSLLGLMAGCSSLGSSHRVPAPVEERQPTKTQSIWSNMPQAKPTAERPASSAPDQPGFYTVRAGDTLIRIGLDQGQNWRDLVRWNNLDNPNSLEVGQVLRVQAPVGQTLASASTNATASMARNEPPTPGVIVRPVSNTVIAPPMASSESSPAPSPSGPPNLLASRPGNLPAPPAPTPVLEGGEELTFA